MTAASPGRGHRVIRCGGACCRWPFRRPARPGHARPCARHGRPGAPPASHPAPALGAAGRRRAPAAAWTAPARRRGSGAIRHRSGRAAACVVAPTRAVPEARPLRPLPPAPGGVPREAGGWPAREPVLRPPRPRLRPLASRRVVARAAAGWPAWRVESRLRVPGQRPPVSRHGGAAWCCDRAARRPLHRPRVPLRPRPEDDGPQAPRRLAGCARRASGAPARDRRRGGAVRTRRCRAIHGPVRAADPPYPAGRVRRAVR